MKSEKSSISANLDASQKLISQFSIENRDWTQFLVDVLLKRTHINIYRWMCCVRSNKALQVA